MQNTSILNRIRMPFGTGRFELEWPKEASTATIDAHELFALNKMHPKPGEELWLGNLNLMVIDYDPSWGEYTVGLASGLSYQAYLWRRFVNLCEITNHRLILTLYVWGLADLPHGEPVSWKLVHWGPKQD